MKKIAFGAVLAATMTTAMAAGGHHAVDDAGMLEPGKCKVESWFSRARGSDRVLHVGTGCRVGPFELNAAAEHGRVSGSSETGYGLSGKWVTELAEGFSAGVSLGPEWAAHARPRYQGLTANGLFTLAVRENVALHANIGRSFAHRGQDGNRWGIDLEWTVRPGWQLAFERYYEDRSHFARAGVRWFVSEAFSVDLSRAQRLSGDTPSNWTLGATFVFGR